MKISVISSGSFGTTMAIMLAEMGNDVCLWSYTKEECENLKRDRENKLFLPGVMIPKNVKHTCNLNEAVDAEIIFSALPSFAVRKTMASLAEFISPGQIIVNGSKGLEIDTYKTMSAIIAEKIPHCELAVMSGPCHAEEVAAKIPTTNVVAAKKEEVANFVQDSFMNPYFRVYTHDDMLGVELGGVLKNIIALCAGISDGLGFGDNTKAALMTRGMYEVTKLGTALGARAETFSGLSGIGDLIVTCTSMHSRNRRAGILIGQGKTAEEAKQEIKMVVEGINTCKAAKILSDKLNVEMPITNEAYKILFENKCPKEATMALMQRGKRRESEMG